MNYPSHFYFQQCKNLATKVCTKSIFNFVWIGQDIGYDDGYFSIVLWLLESTACLDKI